jgi:hypothetical protein
MNTIAESSSRAEIKKVRTPRAMVGEFSAQKAPKSSGKRVLVGESNKTGQNGGAEEPQIYAAPVRSEFTDMFQALSSHSGM